MRHLATFLLCALAMVGCQQADAPNRVQSVSGENLGSAESHKRHEGERKIDLPPRPKVEVVQWRYQQLPDRYQEKVITRTFMVMLETFYGFNGFPDKLAASKFRGMFENNSYNGQPLPTEDWDIRFDFPVQYATFEIGGKPCVAAYRALGEPAGQYQKSSMRAYGCGQAATPMQDYRERALAYFTGIGLND